MSVQQRYMQYSLGQRTGLSHRAVSCMGFGCTAHGSSISVLLLLAIKKRANTQIFFIPVCSATNVQFKVRIRAVFTCISSQQFFIAALFLSGDGQ